MKHYAETVAFLGQWGRFQQVVFFLLCASIVANGFGAFTLVFLTDTPRHHCRVPDVNLTEDWRNFTIPFEVRVWTREPSLCFHHYAQKTISFMLLFLPFMLILQIIRLVYF